MMMMMETKQKENNCNIGKECSSWQTPPPDILEKILQLVYLGDQIRLGLVCKFWRSIVLRRGLRSSPHEIPWLMLPQSPNCNNKLSFLTFPEGKLSKGKVVKFNLPKPVQGGWIYGSSKGWLIIIKEKGLKSKMYLLNPISGALHQLPPLKTILSFKEFLKTREWKLLGANGFCQHAALSTSDGINCSSNFIVAAVFEDRKVLGLCRPGDKKWSVFQVLDINDQDHLLVDILFSSSTLYALVNRRQNGGVAPTYTLNFAYHNDVHLKLKLVYDKHEILKRSVENQSDCKKISDAAYSSMLLESTSKEVLVIHQVVDHVLETKNDGNEQNNENDGSVGGNLNIENDEEDIDDDDDDDDDDNGGSEDDDGGDGDGEEELNNNNDSGDSADDEGGDGEEEGNYQVNYGEEEDLYRNTDSVCLRTNSFRTYKIDPDNNFDMTQCLGDQILFFGDDGYFALPASNIKELEKNCIYFAANMSWRPGLERLPKRYTWDEFGVFYLDGQGIKRPFQGIEISTLYQASWFTPSL